MCNNINRSQWALTLVRIILGVIFIVHGGQKTLGWFGGPGLEGFAGWLGGSFAIPSYLAYTAAWSEFIGGWLLLLGLFAELGALLVIPITVGAIYLVHADKGFFIQNGGYEYVLTLLVLAISIIIGGPGRLALWGYCFCCRR